MHFLRSFFICGPVRNYRRYTGLNLNSTRPPLPWSPSHIEKGETMLFLWKPHTETAGSDTGTHAWLARQLGALAIEPRPLPFFKTVEPFLWGRPRCVIFIKIANSFLFNDLLRVNSSDLGCPWYSWYNPAFTSTSHNALMPFYELIKKPNTECIYSNGLFCQYLITHANQFSGISE